MDAIINFLADAQSLLDFGVGTGRTFPAYPDIPVTGVDFVDTYQEFTTARAKEKRMDYNHVVWKNGNIMPFAAKQFSHAIVCKVLLHVKQPRGIIGELARIAERVLIIDTHAAAEKAQHVTVHNFAELLKNFTILNSETHNEHIIIEYRL